MDPLSLINPNCINLLGINRGWWYRRAKCPALVTPAMRAGSLNVSRVTNQI